MDGINTLRYSDLFLAMYFDGGKSCLHRNHSHVLVYVYSGEMVIDEKGQITRLHKGECAFIRKDFSVQMTKQAWNGEQFKAIFLMFTMKFLRDFYSKLDRNTLPKDAKRDQVSLYKLPSNRPDIVSLFESMTPYFNSKIQPTDELLQLKMIEGVYVLLHTDKNLYASIFDFTDPWKIHFSPWTVPLGRCNCRSKRKEMHGEQISATSSSNAIGHCGASRRYVYCGLCCRV